jgi:coiled-coil domain-containing protein 12
MELGRRFICLMTKYFFFFGPLLTLQSRISTTPGFSKPHSKPNTLQHFRMSAQLSAAADERKARLAKFRSLKRKEREEGDAEDDGTTPAASEAPQQPLHLSLRNYDPETRGPKLGFEAPPVAEEDETLEKQAAAIAAEVEAKAAQDAADDKGVDLFKLQPKKPNWDLKRELGKKQEILSVRTDNAIARLVRERLSAKKASGGDGELDGVTLVEGARLREQEEREEEKRERELDDMV